MTGSIRLLVAAFFGAIYFFPAPVLGQGQVQGQVQSRPNILFLFSDDHATAAISAYGSKINQTPNMDRLAAQGMLFTRCYVTNSICGPSRATIQTGKYSHLNGFYHNGNRFDGSQQTFPKLLQKAGYQTALIGKWHLESTPTGFDHFNILIGQGPYYNPPMIDNGKRVQLTGYTSRIITDQALDWLKAGRDPARPFMLMVQHKAPHREWQPGPEYLDRYKDRMIPEPKTLFDDYAGRGTPARTQDMTISKTLTDLDLKLVPPGNLTPDQKALWAKAYGPENEALHLANLQGRDLVRWKYQRYIKDYLRCVDSVDESLGRLMEHLETSGLAANTVVVYSSDQGFFLGEHGWFDKRWIYQESLRTPLIVRWPGQVKPGGINDRIVSNLDFAQTFLEIAGAPQPPDMQGRSLVPLLQGRDPADWRESFYYHYYEYPGDHSVRRHCGVVTQRYTLAHFYEPDVAEWELYDRENDPQEMRSLHADPAYENVRKELQMELKRLQEHYKETDPHGPVPGGPGPK